MENLRADVYAYFQYGRVTITRLLSKQIKSGLARFFCALAAGFCLLIANSVSAHHGFRVHYDVEQQIEIEGVLQGVKLQNPHSYLEVLVVGPEGNSDVWVCETQAKSVMLRKGISESRFEEGQRITLTGSKARNNNRHCEVGTISFSDETDLVFRSSQGRANIGSYAKPANSAGNTNTIFGTWIRASFRGFPIETNVDEVLTPAGVAANSGYRAATDDPSNFCIAANPVRAWIAPGSPTKISQFDDQVIIQHEFMDVQRTVHLTDQPQQKATIAPSADYQPTNLGFSYGKIEQHSLIVYTSGFSSGVLITQFGESGVLHSDKLRLKETYTVNQSSGELNYYWQAVDENYFPAGIEGKLSLTPVDMQIDRFDCQLDNED